MEQLRSKISFWYVAILLVAIFILQVWALLSYHSLTTDEMAHTVAGIYYLKTGNFQDGFANPPLLQLLYGLPYTVGGLDFDTIGSEPPYAARYVNLLLGTLLTVSVFLFSFKLHGPKGALFSLFLVVTSPTIIAHSSITTTDIGMTLFLVLFCFALWQAHKSSSVYYSALAALALAFSIAAKFTALSFLPVAFLLVLLSPLWSNRSKKDVLIELMIFGLVIWFVFCAFYKFSGCFSIKSDHESVLIRYLGIPFPTLAVKSFCEKLELSRSNLPLHFYLGFSRSTIRWLYYPTIPFFKMPLGSLLFFICALVTLCLKRWKLSKDHLYVLLPAIVFYFSMATNRFHDGVRHLIPALVLFYLGMGAAMSQLVDKSRSFLYFICLIVFLNVFVCLHTYPLYMSSFNWLTPLFSSSIFPASGADVDYAQDDKVVEKYVQRLPKEQKIFLCPFPPTRPRVGHVIINCSAWALFIDSGPGYHWLDGINPRQFIGGSWVHFEVTEEFLIKRAQRFPGKWSCQWPLYEYLLAEGRVDDLFLHTGRTVKTFTESGLYRLRALVYADRLGHALQEYDRLERAYGPYPMSVKRWRYLIVELMGKGKGNALEQSARALLSLRELDGYNSRPYWRKRVARVNYFRDVKTDHSSIELRTVRAHVLFEAGQLTEAFEFYKSLGKLTRQVPLLAQRFKHCSAFVSGSNKDERKLVALVYDRTFAADVPEYALAIVNRLHKKYPLDYYVTSGYHWLAGWQRRGLLSVRLPRKSLFDRVKPETQAYQRR